MPPTPEESASQLRATSDEMLHVIDRLREIERDKRNVPIADDRFTSLAGEAAELSRLVFRWADLQRQLAQDAQADVRAGRIPDRSIRDVVPRPIDRVLASWREAEFRLQAAAPGSPDARLATDDLERLREEYRSVHEYLMAQGGPTAG